MGFPQTNPLLRPLIFLSSAGKNIWNHERSPHRCLLHPPWFGKHEYAGSSSTSSLLSLSNVTTVGAPLAGRLSDKVVAHYRKARGGEWYPEDRLRITTVIGSLFLAPFSVLMSGILTKYVPGRVGLVANLVCLFVNGLGVRLRNVPRASDPCTHAKFCFDFVALVG